MTQNNIIKNQVLALFPDNNNYEISAADMRTYVEAIFSSKEEIVVKIEKMIDLQPNNSNIYKDSLVVVFNDNTNQSGIYLSKKDQPRTPQDLIKLSFLDNEWTKIPEKIYVNINSDYEASLSGEFIYADTTDNAITITIPNSLELNSTIEIVDSSSNFDVNNVTVIDSEGANIGGESQLVLSTKNQSLKVIKGSSQWVIVNE